MRRLASLLTATGLVAALGTQGLATGTAIATITGDDFLDAITLAPPDGVLDVDTTGATSEAGEPVHAGVGSSSLWFRLTPGQTGTLVVDSGGSSFDTVLAVYVGDRVDDLVEVAANDDAGPNRPDPVTSRVELQVTDPDQPLSIALAGFDGQQGAGTISWSLTSGGSDGGDDPAGEETGSTGGTTDDGAAPSVIVATTDPVLAAVAVSQQAFPDGGATRAVLARADVFADTLSGGGLAGDRPLLLTPSEDLRTEVADELERLGTTEVLVLGGPNAVSEQVLEQLAQRGIDATRAFGPNRIETAVAIAEVLTSTATPTTAILARAFPAAGASPTQAFADSMPAGAWAASEGWPVLLSHTHELSEATRNHLVEAGYERVVIVGGEGALSATVAEQVAAVVARVDRVAGTSREGTAIAIARARGVPAARVTIVDGHDPNAWTVGLPAASLGDAVLLARADLLPPETRDFLVEQRTASALCAAGSRTCDEVEALFNPPGIACGTAFEHWGLRGCHTEVEGLDTKFFPLHDGRRPERLALYFHGDGAREFYENWGFDYTILDWAQRNDTMVVGFVSPRTYDNGMPSWGIGDHALADRAEATIEAFLANFGVGSRRSLYWSASGGSWYLAGYFIPLKGDTLPGVFAISCGGAYPWDDTWTWSPETDTTSRAQNEILFNFGSEDFLADGAYAAERRYRERGFSTELLVHDGAEHCRHPIPEPTVEFWARKLD